MSNLDKVFEELHEKLAQRFLDEIDNEECSPATLNAARQFLKDNGITAVLMGEKSDNPFAALAESLIDEDELEQLRMN